MLGMGIFSCSEDTITALGEGFITGTVVDKVSGDPLVGVKISTNPSSTTVFTDDEGAFSIENITVDDYSVQAEFTEYITGFESATVTADNVSIVAFELRKSNSNNQSPSIPELIFPEPNATDVPLEVAFIWDSSDSEDDELTYTLDLRNGATDEMEIFEAIQDTTFTVSNLRLATNYFWQVTVMDEFNEPVNSAIGEFTTIGAPDNPFLFVKKVEGNSVIFSGDDDEDGNQGSIDFNIFQLTDENTNSFRPRRNNIVNKVAFLRTVGGDAHIFSMNLDGTDVQQVTSLIPIAGFRIDELSFTWSSNGDRIYYPYFDKVYAVAPDGSGSTAIYSTPDGSFISEVAVPDFDDDLLLLKTNNASGYNARIYTASIATGLEGVVIHEGEMGAVGSINFSASANEVLYTKDMSGEQNSSYRRFENRIFRYDFVTMESTQVVTNVILGENDLQVRYSPTEGGVVFTRRGNNLNSVPTVFSVVFGAIDEDNELFSEAIMPDWE